MKLKDTLWNIFMKLMPVSIFLKSRSKSNEEQKEAERLITLGVSTKWSDVSPRKRKIIMEGLDRFAKEMKEEKERKRKEYLEFLSEN